MHSFRISWLDSRSRDSQNPRRRTTHDRILPDVLLCATVLRAPTTPRERLSTQTAYLKEHIFCAQLIRSDKNRWFRGCNPRPWPRSWRRTFLQGILHRGRVPDKLGDWVVLLGQERTWWSSLFSEENLSEKFHREFNRRIKENKQIPKTITP